MNQPEVHDIVQALHALTKIAAPAVVFKAEAIVAPDDLVAYLGGHHRYRPECELAYHNQLMVMLWSSLATKDARLAVQSLRTAAAHPGRDVVGDLRALPRRHRVGGRRRRRPCRRLRPVRPPRLPQRLLLRPLPAVLRARCAVRGEPALGRRAHLRHPPRRCAGSARPGSAATTVALDAGIRRLVLLHAVTLGWGGVPLLYMGDELAQDNDAYLPRRSRARRGQPVDAPALLRRRRRGAAPRPGHGRGPGLRLVPGAGPHPGGAVRAARRGGVGGAADRTRRTCWPGVDGIRAAATSSGWSTSRTSPPPSTSACSPGSAGSTPCWPRTGRRAVENGRLRLAGLSFVWLAEE